MEYVTLIEIAPIVLVSMAPLVALGFAIFLVLVLFAWLHNGRHASQR